MRWPPAVAWFIEAEAEQKETALETVYGAGQVMGWDKDLQERVIFLKMCGFGVFVVFVVFFGVLLGEMLVGLTH